MFGSSGGASADAPQAQPRVGIVGVWLESNRIAPVANERDFRDYYWFEGAAILDAARAPASIIIGECAQFVRCMDATGPWEPVPIVIAGCHPKGPIDDALLTTLVAQIEAGLAAAGPLDAVYIANHGGMIAETDDDPDGRIFAAVRSAAGADCRLVATLDLHANISERMVDAVDLIVGYRTNPHVDMRERGEEAALSLRLMLAGEADPKSAFIRLPLTPASVALLTADSAYADMIDFGVRRRAELAGDILNTSVFGGFVFSDSVKNGVAIVVTARFDQERARLVAREIAELGWANKARFVKGLTSIDRALELAKAAAAAPDSPAVIFSDSGDNPGGGGTGRTTAFLEALIEADVTACYYGSFFDPVLAARAHAAGVGAELEAQFNSDGGLPCDLPLTARATVIGLHDGDIVGRLGYAQGKRLLLGPSAALRIGGITVVVISDRMQTADPMFFEMFGFDLADARSVVVKSRGHFRSGFLPWFPPERVFEVDTDGLTSPVLERRQWHHLPRPSFPLDADTTWTPPDWPTLEDMARTR